MGQARKGEEVGQARRRWIGQGRVRRRWIGQGGGRRQTRGSLSRWQIAIDHNHFVIRTEKK